MSEFKGKVVIVTGGALGMGGVTAEEFSNRGALVVVADVNRDAGEVIEGRTKPLYIYAKSQEDVGASA